MILNVHKREEYSLFDIYIQENIEINRFIMNDST